MEYYQIELRSYCLFPVVWKACKNCVVKVTVKLFQIDGYDMYTNIEGAHRGIITYSEISQSISHRHPEYPM